MFRALLSVSLLIPLAAGCQTSGTGSSSASLKPAAPPATPEARRADILYEYVDAARANLSDGKATMFNMVMKLSSEESAKFWPIYHDYEEELFALGDHRVELIRSFVNAQTSKGKLDDQHATVLVDQWFSLEGQRLDLLKKYTKRISDELSPLRGAQFAQLEHRVNTVVDLMLASELPLVRMGYP